MFLKGTFSLLPRKRGPNFFLKKIIQPLIILIGYGYPINATFNNSCPYNIVLSMTTRQHVGTFLRSMQFNVEGVCSIAPLKVLGALVSLCSAKYDATHPFAQHDLRPAPVGEDDGNFSQAVNNSQQAAMEFHQFVFTERLTLSSLLLESMPENTLLDEDGVVVANSVVVAKKSPLSWHHVTQKLPSILLDGTNVGVMLLKNISLANNHLTQLSQKYCDALEQGWVTRPPTLSQSNCLRRLFNSSSSSSSPRPCTEQQLEIAKGETGENDMSSSLLPMELEEVLTTAQYLALACATLARQGWVPTTIVGDDVSSLQPALPDKYKSNSISFTHLTHYDKELHAMSSDWRTYFYMFQQECHLPSPFRDLVQWLFSQIYNVLKESIHTHFSTNMAVPTDVRLLLEVLCVVAVSDFVLLPDCILFALRYISMLLHMRDGVWKWNVHVHSHLLQQTTTSIPIVSHPCHTFSLAAISSPNVLPIEIFTGQQDHLYRLLNDTLWDWFYLTERDITTTITTKAEDNKGTRGILFTLLPPSWFHVPQLGDHFPPALQEANVRVWWNRDAYSTSNPAAPSWQWLVGPLTRDCSLLQEEYGKLLARLLPSPHPFHLSTKTQYHLTAQSLIQSCRRLPFKESSSYNGSFTSIDYDNSFTSVEGNDNDPPLYTLIDMSCCSASLPYSSTMSFDYVCMAEHSVLNIVGNEVDGEEDEGVTVRDVVKHASCEHAPLDVSVEFDSFFGFSSLLSSFTTLVRSTKRVNVTEREEEEEGIGAQPLREITTIPISSAQFWHVFTWIVACWLAGIQCNLHHIFYAPDSTASALTFFMPLFQGDREQFWHHSYPLPPSERAVYRRRQQQQQQHQRGNMPPFLSTLVDCHCRVSNNPAQARKMLEPWLEVNHFHFSATRCTGWFKSIEKCLLSSALPIEPLIPSGMFDRLSDRLAYLVSAL